MDADARATAFADTVTRLQKHKEEYAAERVAAMQELCALTVERQTPFFRLAEKIRAITPEDLDAFIAGEEK